jgi:hypothetical protein
MLSMKYLNMNLLRIKPAPQAGLNEHRERRLAIEPVLIEETLGKKRLKDKKESPVIPAT